jgi:hypothetical protein
MGSEYGPVDLNDAPAARFLLMLAHFAAQVLTEAVAGADTADVSVAPQMVLSLENVECPPR